MGPYSIRDPCPPHWQEFILCWGLTYELASWSISQLLVLLLPRIPSDKISPQETLIIDFSTKVTYTTEVGGERLVGAENTRGKDTADSNPEYPCDNVVLEVKR